MLTSSTYGSFFHRSSKLHNASYKTWKLIWEAFLSELRMRPYKAGNGEGGGEGIEFDDQVNSPLSLLASVDELDQVVAITTYLF